MRTQTKLSPADLRHFEGLLLEERRELDVALDRITHTLDDVIEARNSGTADDEHDPEGPTLTMEWSRISGVHSEFEAKAATVDRALARISDGSYGLCVRGGEPIGRARLEARPAAELCIDCARDAEARPRA
ncbi:TraR/DksA family transcriptional regulator [Cryobacterium algoritolerans]|uniref:TraR/DksA family transcriptional regulator n=1 Tax=Cryobacterium algoritolerans TaxID=1259184 RepID=A0A4R8WR32_9MICO|nr:TraR/DksA family transcriptional regulator [Cryobacterium algoritolerans]TFC14665.1 TraR/DksA family transcriptional regulator [Cryobacterium algoritolerans]